MPLITSRTTPPLSSSPSHTSPFAPHQQHLLLLEKKTEEEDPQRHHVWLHHLLERMGKKANKNSTHKRGKAAVEKSSSSSSNSHNNNSNNNNNNNNDAPNKRAERQTRRDMQRNKRKEDAKRTWAVKAQDLAQFSTQLAPLGLELRDVKGDGNCLFRALADQLNGDNEDNHRALRDQIVDYIANHRDDFEPFLEAEEEESFEDYVDDLRKDGFYAGHWALVAASRLLRVNISIHQIEHPIWNILYDPAQEPTFNNHSQRPVAGRTCTLHVAYYGWEHYSSLRRIGGPYGGPANIDLDNVVVDTKAHGSSSSSTVQKSGQDLMKFNEQIMMESTGCQDITRIRNILEAHNDHLNDALDELMMLLSEERTLEASMASTLAEGHTTDSDSYPTNSIDSATNGVAYDDFAADELALAMVKAAFDDEPMQAAEPKNQKLTPAMGQSRSQARKEKKNKTKRPTAAASAAPAPRGADEKDRASICI